MRFTRSWQVGLSLQDFRALFADPQTMARCSPGCQGVEVDSSSLIRLLLAVPQLQGVRLAVELRQHWLSPEQLEVHALSQSALGTVTARGVWTWAADSLSLNGEAWLGGALASVAQRVLEPLARRWLDEFVARLSAGLDTSRRE